jgi:hypothetical protein
MAGKKVAVFGIYSTRAAVENAADALVKSGFPSSDISVLLPESLGGPKEMGTEKATKAPEGTAAGATAGGLIGGTLGVLAGVGLLAIPGLGPFIAAGPIMAGLAGLGVGGAVGGVTGALIGMGIPEFEASATKAGCRRAAFFCRCTAIRPKKSSGRKTSSSALVERMSRLRVKRRVMRRRTTAKPRRGQPAAICKIVGTWIEEEEGLLAFFLFLFARGFGRGRFLGPKGYR